MDPDQLGLLIDHHASALELYARQWCAEPEDVVQDAFVKLAGQGTPPHNPLAWLFRTVRNGAINAGIAQKRRRRHEALASEQTRVWFDQSPPGPNPSLIDPESAQHALSSLPLKEREVIVAHVWGGLTFEQIAELAGTSASSAHRLYQSGMNTLRERLGVLCRTSQTRPTQK